MNGREGRKENREQRREKTEEVGEGAGEDEIFGRTESSYSVQLKHLDTLVYTHICVVSLAVRIARGGHSTCM